MPAMALKLAGIGLAAAVAVPWFVPPRPSSDEPRPEPTHADGKEAHPDARPTAVAPFAGRYYHGDGLGVNCSMKIEPEGRFSFGWSGCMGTYAQNVGGAELAGGHVMLRPEKPNDREKSLGTPTDFVPVRWGDRIYMIAAEDRADFCNAVNHGSEPRYRPHGEFYLRDGDDRKPAKGPPGVPKDWEPLILKEPIRGKMTEVVDKDRAVVDLGADDGAWKGMELWLDRDHFGKVEVAEVRPKSSVVVRTSLCSPEIVFQPGMTVESEASWADLVRSEAPKEDGKPAAK